VELKIREVERKRLSDQVIKQILSLIASGKLNIGDKLPSEQALMRQFNVGRSSIREAMGALTLAGVVSVRPGHGTRVISTADSFPEIPHIWRKSCNLTKLEELLETRMILEEAAAELAAMRATEEDIREIKEDLDKLSKARKNRKQFIRSSLSFHLSIAKASHNNMLADLYSSLMNLIRIGVEQSTPYDSTRDIDFTVEHHAKIFEAIEKRDVEKACSLVREHLQLAYPHWASELGIDSIKD